MLAEPPDCTLVGRGQLMVAVVQIRSLCGERGLSVALILAEPVLRAHPERHVLPPGVRVAGDVPVTARRAKVAAGHRQPLGGTGFLLAYDRPLDADIAVGRAGVLHAQAEPASGADRCCQAFNGHRDAIWSMTLAGADRHWITSCEGHGVTDPEVSPSGTML